MDPFKIPVGSIPIIGQKIRAYKLLLNGAPTKVTEEKTPNGIVISILFEGPNLQVTDGYHTMEELYLHRYELFLALVKIYDNYITPLNTRVKCWKSKFHDDGTMFDDSFIVGMTITEFEKPDTQITYHMPLRYWHLFNVMELEKAPPYDGHSSSEVLRRLRKL
jgi:hypothetical protein